MSIPDSAFGLPRGTKANGNAAFVLVSEGGGHLTACLTWNYIDLHGAQNSRGIL